MAYGSQRMSPYKPGLIMILIDQSASMAEPYFRRQTKAEYVALRVNRIIYDLIEACKDKGDPQTIIDRCYVGVIGYGREIVPVVGGLISDVAKNPLDITDGSKKRQKPIWVKAKANDGTPMAKVMETTYCLIQEWVKLNPESLCPIVINIIGGKPNDMESGPRDGSETKLAAEKLMSLKTTDGHLLLFNVHISNSSPVRVIPLPRREPKIDNYATFLFNISSQLPERLWSKVQKKGLQQPLRRAFAYNADAQTMIKPLKFALNLLLREQSSSHH